MQMEHVFTTSPRFQACIHFAGLKVTVDMLVVVAAGYCDRHTPTPLPRTS